MRVDVHHVRRVPALLELLGNGGHLWRHVPVAAQTAGGQAAGAARPVGAARRAGTQSRLTVGSAELTDC